MSKLRIGTRGSELALVQARATEAALGAAFPERTLERVVIKTTGDRRTDVALSEVAKAEGIYDKGVFIKELEIALEEGRIDIAVHSLKDVPTVLEEHFEIAGVLPRAPIRDVLVSPDPGGLDALGEGARVGTSSVRRARQLEWLRPDLQLVDIRGNVPTRLRKLAEGEFDAIMLAEAGLVRLGHPMDTELELEETTLHFHPLDEAEFLPAAGQGAIAFEIRSDDESARGAIAAINDEPTFIRITAEREFLRLLDGGCHTPVGVVTRLEDGVLSMTGRVFPEEGGKPREGAAAGQDPIEVAGELFESLA
ncbi:hydroxymethylbilane synthase [Haloferula sp. A504]|uniref:hydroxymethylbilane synthase n=1 Tax=Haloferula sp. A504 TaxID=3373601 RepID=UPI0031BBD7D9|nr:hydroxymethylbilane synthase [Verrucomicrobiaceae bacterium E54]